MHELQKIVPMPAIVAKGRRCAEGPCVNTMLDDRTIWKIVENLVPCCVIVQAVDNDWQRPRVDAGQVGFARMIRRKSELLAGRTEFSINITAVAASVHSIPSDVG